ncbi:MAG: efflux RND transporter periplasmic adaptor subunit [Flavobacteriales bacterium]|nr:efflux RND transporter periplasmic adaptor subunit [Flavobacteriales bacterium]
MKKYILFITSLAVISCGSDSSQDPHDHQSEEHEHAIGAADEHEGHEHSEDEHAEKTVAGEITFTPQMAALGTFAVEKTEKSPFFSIIKTSGRSISSPVGESIVVAPSDGIITFIGTMSEGANIGSGVTLMSISSKKIAEGDTYSRITEQYNYAKTQWERAEKLIKDRIISQNEYDAAHLEYLNKKNAFDALSADKSGNISVKTPFAGYIKNIATSQGAFVNKGDALFSIMKSNRARLEVDVPQKYFTELKNVVSATFTSADGKTYDTATLNGKIISYSKSVSSAGMLSMTIEYDGVADMPEGAFVKVSLRLKDNADVLTVPLSAITEEQGEYFVYVQLDEECYQKRPVTLGGNDGIRTVIASGISENDIVVTRGTYRVKLAGNTGAIPHSHEH